MPNQPSWIESVPEILETLRAPGTPPFLDRPTVEVLFGVRRRQAIHLLRRFGGYQVGKTFLVGYFYPSPRKGLIGIEKPHTMSANH
jgi:hypothetical protein